MLVEQGLINSKQTDPATISVQVKASTVFMVDKKKPLVRTAPLDQSLQEPSQHAICLSIEIAFFFPQQHLGALFSGSTSSC